MGTPGVNGDGRCELLGLKVGNSETEAFWAEFISDLKERGLDGVKLVISDAHSGLTKAIRRQLQGSVWQRRTERCAWQHSSDPFRPQPAAVCPSSRKASAQQ
ncbi:MAG: transposase [Synechococcaceae cyanobacterium]